MFTVTSGSGITVKESFDRTSKGFSIPHCQPGWIRPVISPLFPTVDINGTFQSNITHGMCHIQRTSNRFSVGRLSVSKPCLESILVLFRQADKSIDILFVTTLLFLLHSLGIIIIIEIQITNLGSLLLRFRYFVEFFWDSCEPGAVLEKCPTKINAAIT
jgi:hypothetical protein